MSETIPPSVAGNAGGIPPADDPRGSGRLPGRAGRGRRVWLQRAGLVVALLATLAAGSVLTSRWLASRPGAPTAAAYRVPPPVELPLFRDGEHCGQDGCAIPDLVCPFAAAWSPDQRQVAILSSCDAVHSDSNKLLIYDTATGHLRALIALDDIIARAPNIPDNCKGEPRGKGLRPSNLFWLPSGRLAITGFVYLWTALLASAFCPPPWDGPVDALVLIDADGTHPQVARVPARTRKERADGADGVICGRTWDLQGAIPVPAAVSTEGDDCQLAPALGYRWVAGGGLQPLTPLTRTTAPPAPGPGPVGTPYGGSEFTVWQRNGIWRPAPSPVSTPGATPATGLYLLGLNSLSAFSPDGRYVHVDQPFHQYRLVLAGQPTPSPDELKQALADDLPLLPVKDAALQRALAALPLPVKSGNRFKELPTSLAWRPDGAMLATLTTTFDGTRGEATNAQQPVQVLDCATGSVRLRLTPLADPAHKQLFDSNILLSWSPDGSHLLLVSGSRGTATLWDLSGLH